jgi:cell division protein FtsX
MVAVNKVLAKRVEELTELLVDVRESASDIGADEIVEQIDDVIGTEEVNGETPEEEFEQELDDDPEEGD